MELARWAADPAYSRGRLYPEPPSRLRTAFARDRDRLIHATAFRRLRHKTQVFVAPDGDHFRVRLTHSLEVAQIGRTLARALKLEEDLTEVLALAHDIGHPPFGHAGEDALTAAMAPFGGFDHNGHTVRVLTLLESRNPDFEGLNLSWETLEGLAKHNGPVSSPGWALAGYDAAHPLELDTHASLEAQIASLADDIAYNAHDLDDGLRAGILSLEEALATVPLLNDIWSEVRRRWPVETRMRRLAPQLIRELIGVMVEGLLAETRASLAEAEPEDVDAVRRAGRPLARFPASLTEGIAPLRQYLREKMYRHPQVMQMRTPAESAVSLMFGYLLDHPESLPERWREEWPAEPMEQGRHVGDYIAGMTDHFALTECTRLTGFEPEPGNLMYL
ncbi:MAG: deoxyguanosinetriphosphate triphosphohydrolase [Sphingomonadaceae bacterium]